MIYACRVVAGLVHWWQPDGYEPERIETMSGFKLVNTDKRDRIVFLMQSELDIQMRHVVTLLSDQIASYRFNGDGHFFLNVTPKGEVFAFPFLNRTTTKGIYDTLKKNKKLRLVDGSEPKAFGRTSSGEEITINIVSREEMREIKAKHDLVIK